MSIKASSTNLQEFFTGNDDTYSSSRLIVPAFQRNYAWDIKHIKDLIESINANPNGYYIGNILIQYGYGSNSKDLIIDGQQRLTSLFLIIKALDSLGLSKANTKIVNSILFVDNTKDKARLGFIRTNLNNSFCSILENNFEEPIFSDDNSKKFVRNFNFVRKALIEIEDTNLFFKKIISTVFVIIKFNDGYDVNQLFEGLNSKGKILSTVQLTKNALFGSSKDDLNYQRIINIWEEIECDFEKNNVIWFDKFLRHTGFYKYGYVSNKNLFAKIKESLRDSGSNLLKFSKELKSDSDLYIKIRTATLLKNEISKNLSLSEWRTIEPIILNLSQADLDQVYSVLFALVRYGQYNLGYFRHNGTQGSKFLKDIKKLWAFSILNKYLDTKPSLYETKYAILCHSLFKNEIIDKKRTKFFNDINGIVSNSSIEKFKKNINNRIKITGEDNKKITSKNNRNYISQLLFFYLEEGKRFSMEGLTIEHIIPKGKKDGLRKWANISPKFLKEIKDVSRYKLGNLTLVEKDNGGNENFDTKMKLYKKDKYKRNNEIAKYRELFNSENPTLAVNERGEEIGSAIYELLIRYLK